MNAILIDTRTSRNDLSHQELTTLYRTLGGHIYFQTLSAAVRLDLFGVLSRRGPLSCPEIAIELGIGEKSARILLLGCTSLDLLEKAGARYSNTRISETMLVREAPGNIVSVIEWQHCINYRAMYWLYESVVEGKNAGLREFAGEESTLYERLAHDPRLERVFQDAMHDISVQANEMLCQHVDFSGVRHVVDVGGGNGTNAIKLAEEHPHLRVTVFDSQSVCRIADQNICDAGLSDRVCAFSGNCFDDPFPQDVDCLLFAHFLTIWSEEKNRMLLRKACNSLPPGGRAIVFNMMQSDSEDGPLSAAMGSPYFLALATGEGMMYTWWEYESWLREAGFQTIQRQVLPLDHGAIVGVKAC